MVVLGAAWGVVAVGVSADLGGAPARYNDRFVPWLASVWEGQDPWIALLLLLVGSFGLASIRPRLWLAVGLSTMVVFGLLAAIEVSTGAGSHNLWPIEWGFYFLWSIPGFAGAATAWVVFTWRRSIRDRNAAQRPRRSSARKPWASSRWQEVVAASTRRPSKWD
ncbi:MAG: hypothetical protein U0X73_08025 [Thermoanaerobaculia bacterium]